MPPEPGPIHPSRTALPGKGARVIAVSQRVTVVPAYKEYRDCLDQAWALWLESLGLVCVPIPNRASLVAELLTALRPSGIVLTGGNNLAFDVYDGLPEGSQIPDAYPSRDATERALVDFAIARKVPLLGCCRGMQFLQAYFGGRLAPLPPEAVAHVATTHPLTVLADAFRPPDAAELRVNSFHDYGFSRAQTAPALRPFAVSSDDLVEGLFHPDLPIWGIMWHPERPNPGAAYDRLLAARLFGMERPEARP